MKILSQVKGLSVIEIIIAAAIIVTVVTAAAGAWQLNLRVSASSITKTQAALLTEEMAEILQFLRDESWTSHIAPLSLNTPYQVVWSGGKFSITQAETLIQDKYVRTFTLSAVDRNTTTHNIATSGTTEPDPETKKVEIDVFFAGATSTPLMQSEMLIHNVYAN